LPRLFSPVQPGSRRGVSRRLQSRSRAEWLGGIRALCRAGANGCVAKSWQACALWATRRWRLLVLFWAM